VGSPELVAHGGNAVRGKFLQVGKMKRDKTGETVHNRVIGLRHHIDATDTFETEYIMTIDTINTFKAVSAAIYNGINALETINEQAKALKAGGIVFGKSKKTCQYRVQLGDAMKAQFKGKAEKTYANYVTGFVAAVNEGVPFSFSSSKGKGKAKGKGTDKDTTIYPLLAKLFGHESFKATMADIQSAYENDEGDITAIIQSMLEAEGYEITE
jgi:hypothetical protein